MAICATIVALAVELSPTLASFAFPLAPPARATLGRVPIAGPVLASAVGGAIMQEVSNQNVIDKVNDKGKEVLNKSSETRDDIIFTYLLT